LQDAKKYKTIVTNVYKRYSLIYDIKVSVKQNWFEKIVFVKQDFVLYNY